MPLIIDSMIGFDSSTTDYPGKIPRGADVPSDDDDTGEEHRLNYLNCRETKNFSLECFFRSKIVNAHVLKLALLGWPRGVSFLRNFIQASASVVPSMSYKHY